MDAQEHKDDLKEAKRLMERVKKLLFGCGEKCLAWDANDLINDICDAILDADQECRAEQRMENDALTKAFFEDAI